MLDVAGERLQPEECEKIAHPLVGGLILFARNLTSIEQVKALTADIKKINPNICIAVDQEGGRVQRLKSGFTDIPPMGTLGTLFDSDPAKALTEAKYWGKLMATEVQSVGIHLSFAPVLDVDTGVSDVIGDRAFHQEPQVIVQLAKAFIAGMHEMGMSAVGKHFPGHGSVSADSHIDLPVDHRSFDEIEAKDLIPFQQLAGDLQGIMPAHVIYDQVDDKPAGFSRYWLQTILRERCQFKGTIFSDDLCMAGAKIAGDITARAHAALAAGCDMILVCNEPAEAETLLDTLSIEASNVIMNSQTHTSTSL